MVGTGLTGLRVGEEKEEPHHDTEHILISGDPQTHWIEMGPETIVKIGIGND